MKKLKKHKTKDFYVVKDTYPEIILGSLVTLPGPSGGRTTLRMIAGFESPDEGEICLGGEAINALTPSKREPPWYSGTPHYNIFDNVAYGLKLREPEEERVQPMENSKTLEEVRRIFEGDRFATENGAVIEKIGDHSAVCSLVIRDSHRNAMGAVMGGTYFMLADFAFAVAANWEKMGCVSLHADISFLGAARGQKLIAEAVCVKNGRTTACYRVDVRDELGNLAATVTTTGYHVG